MGIHFVCHHCSYALHVKNYQAGKRGKCPSCKGSFRIPSHDSSYSFVLEEESDNPAVINVRSAFEKTNKTSSKSDQSPSDSIAITLEPNSSSSATPFESKKTAVVASKYIDTTLLQLDPNVAIRPSGEPIGTQFMPAVLAEFAEAKWFVRPPSGGQFGPAPPQLLMAWITESRVTSESYLWREGLEQWQLASELVPELFPSEANTLSTPPSLTDILSGDRSKLGLNTAELSLDAAPTARSGLVLKKQMQKRRQQLTMIILLAIISFVLFSILIYVLVFQATKPSQPAVMTQNVG